MINDVHICVNGSMIFTNNFLNFMIGPCMAKRRMGKGLERISRGKKRPEAPVQAAKLASEAGIIIRDHIPVFPHWKDYMKDDAEAIRNDYMGKIAVSVQLVFSVEMVL